MSLVIDCSVVIAWLLPDEDSTRLTKVFEQIAEAGAIVPAHWPLEVANTLAMAERRGRIDAGFVQETLADLALLPIIIDAETSRTCWTDTMALARRYRLTIYDAAYLELALRRQLPLATLDTHLADAARLAGLAPVSG